LFIRRFNLAVKMKLYFLKVLLFILLISVTCVIIELMLRQIPNDYRLKREYLDVNSDKIEILFLGGSHALHGLNPVYTKKRSFNAAHNSQSLDYDLEILRKYRNNWANLQYIVLPISYPSLFERIEDSIEGWRVKNYILYYGIRISKHLAYYAEITNGILWVHFQRLFDFYFRSIDNIECSELGWANSYMPGSSEDLFETGIEAAKRNTIPADRQYVEEMNLALDSIVHFADKNGTRILLFTPPAHISYIENLNNAQWNKTLLTALGFASEYKNCYYVNMLDDKNFTDNDFHDGDHLNTLGAKKLTMMIDSIINLN